MLLRGTRIATFVFLEMEETHVEASASTPYAPLGPTNIRVVDVAPGFYDDPLCISIRTVDLNDQPRHVALSHVCNPTDGTIDAQSLPEPVEVFEYPDLKLHLGPNLASAIRQLRAWNEVTFWIDVMSINQVDVQERSQQVALMWKIYSFAKDVYIWLGPEQNDSGLALDMITTSRFKVKYAN